MSGEGEARGRLRGWLQRPETAGVFTDIDGTLAPIAPTPDSAEVAVELRELLRRLGDRYAVVAGISGRSTGEARALIGLDEVVYFGNHGFDLLRDGEVETVREAAPYAAAVRELEELARRELAPLGAFVEDKGITASIHYRTVPEEAGERCVEFVQREGERLGLRIMVGRGVVEARPPVRVDKGTAARRLVEDYGLERALFIGDDRTDLDAFRELRGLLEQSVLREALRIGVRSAEGPREVLEEADLVVDGVGGVGELLEVLLEDV